MKHSPVMRTLSAVTLVNTLGNGMFMTVSALYFTRVIGLSVAQLGLGLAAAGLCGVASGVPLGRLADRVGARRLLIVLFVIEAGLVALYPLAGSFPAFLGLVCAATFVERGANGVRLAVVMIALPPDERVRGRAFLRVLTNVGMGAGSAVAALALHADTREAYTAVILADAVTFAVSAVLLLRLPVTPPAPAQGKEAPARDPLKDGPYLLITLICGVMMLQAGILEVGLPLWIADHTDAPTPVVAAAFVLNTALVVAFQVRLSRGTEHPARAARVNALAGLLLAVACLGYALTSGRGAVAATVLLLLVTAVYTVGEMLTAAGGWALSMELADDRAPGAYQGVFNSGFTAGVLLAPALVTATALDHGTAGWAFLAALFLATGRRGSGTSSKSPGQGFGG
ncbi:MFS transporter, partial [Actinocorallia lasiicapitis]